jgi:branched-subunit amino acid aminotransferase/4-amino-4-deoxychorismate lyase
MGELTPVNNIDGRVIGDGSRGPITLRLQQAYRKKTEVGGVPVPGFN